MVSLRRAKIFTVIQANLNLSAEEMALIQFGYIENTIGLSADMRDEFKNLYQKLAQEYVNGEEDMVNGGLVGLAVSEDQADVSRSCLLDSLGEYASCLDKAGIDVCLLFGYFSREVSH